MVLAGLLLAACLGCGEGDGGDEFAVYHLEAAIGRPGDEGELRCGPPRPVCPGVVRQPPPRTFRYPVHGEPALTERDILRSSVQGEGTAILIPLTASGSRAFAAVTKTAARIGGRDQVWHHVALVVGDEIVAFPEIDFDLYPDGFVGSPGIQFTAASGADARDLVRRLRGG